MTEEPTKERALRRRRLLIVAVITTLLAVAGIAVWVFMAPK